MTDQTFFMTASEVEDAYGIDLISAETLRNGLIEVTKDMHGTLLRSSFSSVIRDGMDFGVCVHLVGEDNTTELVSVTEGCTQFAFTMQHMTNMVLDEYGVENLGPGDTLVCNDAFRGGIHFGDLNLFRVIHDEDGKPAFVLSDAAHVFDIGGPVAGGFNNTATSMYEEGLRIPPMLVTSGETLVRPTINLILENTRNPFMMVGDVRALLGTLKRGEDRLRELMARYGTATVKSAARYALGLSERRMRKALLDVPDGDYSDEITLDDDGVVIQPVTLKLELRVRGAEAELDFSGTDPQTLGPLTTCWEEATRVLIGPKLILDPRHPMNAGAMRPFQVLLPPGSVVLGLPPTSQCNHIEPGAKVTTLATSVMSRAVPERGVAWDSATSGALIVAGVDQRPGHEGNQFGAALVPGTAWGGTQSCDGISFCQSAIYNCRSTIIEYLEMETPVIVWGSGIVIDSAGAGKFRGGFAPAFTIEAVTDVWATPLFDSSRAGPKGLDGGGPGVTSHGMLIAKDEHGSVASWNGVLPSDRMTPLFGIFDDDQRPDPDHGVYSNGTRFETSKITAMTLAAGEVLRLHSPCGGGYGDPLERDAARVVEDVANERVSVTQAADVYGVVVNSDTLHLDEEATRARRADLASQREAGTWQPSSFFQGWPRTQQEFEELTRGRAPQPV